MSFAQHARSFRESLGLTQKGLAVKLGVSVNTIQDMERGAHGNGRDLSTRTKKRYRLLCAGMMHEKQKGGPLWPLYDP